MCVQICVSVYACDTCACMRAHVSVCAFEGSCACEYLLCM